MEGSYVHYTLQDIYDSVMTSKSRIGGIVLYDNTHPNISKVLQDTEYWKCLDDLSGPNWPIFAALYPKKAFPKPRNSNNYSGLTQFLFLNYEEPEIRDEFVESFHLNKNTDVPCFVLLTWDDDKNIHFCHCKINDYSVDSALNSLREIIKVVADAEKKILDENKQTDRVFIQSAIQLDGFTKRKMIRRIPFGSLIDFFQLIHLN